MVDPSGPGRSGLEARGRAGAAQAEAAQIADQQHGWVARLPPRLRDYALLARWDRPIGSWLLYLPCLWGLALAPAPFDLGLAALFAVGAVAMRGAGCTVNDILDREYDRKVARTRNRPLAAGRIGVGEAALFALAQSAVGLLVLLLLPPFAALVAVLSVPLILVYPLMKRITHWPQLVLGLAFNWGALVGYAAAAGRLEPAAWLLYAAGVCWTLVYDTVYAHQDKEDDRLVGVKSTALLFGARSRLWIALFAIGMLGLLAAAGLAGGLGPAFLAALALPAGLLAWQLRTVDFDDRNSCLFHFRLHREVGLSVLFALLLGRWIG